MDPTPEQFVVDRFAAAAKTPFGTLNPAKVVTATMLLLHELRDDHQLAWKSIAPMFNAAMTKVGGKTLTSAALCRLFNIERQKETLRALQRHASAACRSPEEVAPEGSGPGNAEDLHRTAALEPATEAAPQVPANGERAIAVAPVTPSNRVRDGPIPERVAGAGAVPANRAAQLLERLEEKRNFDRLRNKGTRNGRD